jgi:hypothetical protein
MMKEFGVGRKVRCHRGAVENCGESESPPCLCKGRRDKDGAPGFPILLCDFHKFISFDVHMTLPLIPKWEYWK